MMKLKTMPNNVQFQLLILLVQYFINPCWTFFLPQNHQKQRYPRSSSKATSTQSHLVPLSTIPNTSHKSFLSSPESYRICIDSNGQFYPSTANLDSTSSPNYYTLCLAEEDDLPSIATFTIDAFGGADVINISNNNSDLTSFEKALLSPGISIFNNYANVVAFQDVLSGLRKRLYQIQGEEEGHDSSGGSIVKPFIIGKSITNDNLSSDQMEEIASQSSVIFVLAKYEQNNTNTEQNNVIATVEIRLQPTDAKIPFTQPWFDKIERKLASFLPSPSTSITSNNQALSSSSSTTTSLQPYLSNLCVSSNYRNQKIGKALCRAVESLVRDTWNYNMIYLHVDLDNVSALRLYEKEGYVDVGMRWNPFWAGGASEIGYFVKKL